MERKKDLIIIFKRKRVLPEGRTRFEKRCLRRANLCEIPIRVLFGEAACGIG